MMQNNLIESSAKIKIKEYFENNKVLTHENFNKFIEFIGLRDIWSSEDQKFLWETITLNATDKNNIDYESALNGICSFFEQDDGKDIDDIYINIKDINSNESNNINTLDSKKIIENEKCIDEFLNTINNNQDTLYNIRFINEIFFSQYLNNIKNIEDLENNKERIKINYDDIIEKLKNDYKFLKIKTETLKTYLNYINDNKYLEDEENEHKNYYLNKQLINYVNVVIDLKIEENNKNHNINLSNSSLSNVSNNNINGNSIELSIEKLSLIDTNLIDCLDGVEYLNTNINFIKMIKKYIENYINYLRQSIYNDIKSKELELQQKIIQSNNTCNKCKNDIDKENKKLKEDMTTLLRKNTKMKNEKKNKDLSGSKIININEIMNNNKDSTSSNVRNSLSMPKEQKRKTTQLNKIPVKKTYLSKISSDNLQKIKTEPTHKNILNLQNKILNGVKSRTYSSVDGNIEDMTNSRIDLFSSTNGNVNGDLIFLDTTKLYNDNMEDETLSNKNANRINSKSAFQKKVTLPKNKKINNYNFIDTSIDNNNESSIKINNEENDDDFDDIKSNFLTNRKSICSNNFFFAKKNYSSNTYDYYPNGNENITNTDFFQSIDNCYNTFAYGPLNGKSFFDISKKDKLENLENFYDFKYLAYSNRVKRFFKLNNEKLNIDDFFSEEINAYFSKSNKQNCIIVITSCGFNFFKPDTLECIIRVNLKSLESITISLNNFNLLLLSFKSDFDVIIESFQRMKLLLFLNQAIAKRQLEKEIRLYTSNKFYFRKKNKKKEPISIFKNKLFNLTPNLENAQKVGMLLKYQENIFSATFHKKLVALCSIGLVYFNDNKKLAKEIIPIIGTSIRLICVQTNELIYCLKFVTINNEEYIFGSLKKREILDWQKEIYKFKKRYDNQMKMINPVFSRKSYKFENNEDEDIFSKKTDNEK